MKDKPTNKEKKRPSIKRLFKFETVGILMTGWGLLWAGVIDAFQLSALMVMIYLIIPTHLLKFVLYSKVFK